MLFSVSTLKVSFVMRSSKTLGQVLILVELHHKTAREKKVAPVKQNTEIMMRNVKWMLKLRSRSKF